MSHFYNNQEVRNEKMKIFCSTLNVNDEYLARSYLSNANWDVNKAIDLFLDKKQELSESNLNQNFIYNNNYNHINEHNNNNPNNSNAIPLPNFFLNQIQRPLSIIHSIHPNMPSNSMGQYQNHPPIPPQFISHPPIFRPPIYHPPPIHQPPIPQPPKNSYLIKEINIDNISSSPDDSYTNKDVCLYVDFMNYLSGIFIYVYRVYTDFISALKKRSGLIIIAGENDMENVKKAINYSKINCLAKMV